MFHTSVVNWLLNVVPGEGMRGYPPPTQDGRYFPSYYAGSLPRDRYPPPRSNIDAYATLTPSERMAGSKGGQGQISSMMIIT